MMPHCYQPGPSLGATPSSFSSYFFLFLLLSCPSVFPPYHSFPLHFPSFNCPSFTCPSLLPPYLRFPPHYPSFLLLALYFFPPHFSFLLSCFFLSTLLPVFVFLLSLLLLFPLPCTPSLLLCFPHYLFLHHYLIHLHSPFPPPPNTHRPHLFLSTSSLTCSTCPPDEGTSG